MRNASWLMVALLAAALVVPGSVLAQECRDRDRDGYQVRIDPDGTILDPCGIDSGIAVRPPRHGLATNGEQHALVYQDWPEGASLPEGVEIYMARFTSDLQNLDPGGRRLTFTPEHSGAPAIIWGPAEWGIAWDQEFPSLFDSNIAFMRVGTDGEVIDPPGTSTSRGT